MYCPWIANFTGSHPNFCTFETSTPIGKVTLLPALVYQLTSMFGEVRIAQRRGRKYWIKYCKLI